MASSIVPLDGDLTAEQYRTVLESIAGRADTAASPCGAGVIGGHDRWNYGPNFAKEGGRG